MRSGMGETPHWPSVFAAASYEALSGVSTAQSPNAR